MSLKPFWRSPRLITAVCLLWNNWPALEQLTSYLQKTITRESDLMTCTCGCRPTPTEDCCRGCVCMICTYTCSLTPAENHHEGVWSVLLGAASPLWKIVVMRVCDLYSQVQPHPCERLLSWGFSLSPAEDLSWVCVICNCGYNLSPEEGGCHGNLWSLFETHSCLRLTWCLQCKVTAEKSEAGEKRGRKEDRLGWGKCGGFLHQCATE